MAEIRVGMLSRTWHQPPGEWVGWHDFDGEWMPIRHPTSREVPGSRFSVGVFQWVRTVNRKGIKRGPVLVRVAGPVTEEQEVSRMAAQVCFLLDAGTYTGPKTITVAERRKP